jgi:hypothetical protein
VEYFLNDFGRWGLSNGSVAVWGSNYLPLEDGFDM